MDHNPNCCYAHQTPEELAPASPASRPVTMPVPQAGPSAALHLALHTHSQRLFLWALKILFPLPFPQLLSLTCALFREASLGHPILCVWPCLSPSGDLSCFLMNCSFHSLSVICFLLSGSSLELPCQPHTPEFWYNDLGQSVGLSKTLLNELPSIWLLPSIYFSCQQPLPASSPPC